MELLINASIKDPIDILKFWHCIEFFVPFDLNNAFSQSKSSTQLSLTETQLTQGGNCHLPWLSELTLNKAGGLTAKKYSYNLYLLPFNKSELTKISKQVFESKFNQIETIEFEEKFDDSGLTCFAKLSLDNEGCFDTDKISVSTLPWALGRLSRYDLDGLNHKYYEQEQEKLKAELNVLGSHLRNSESALITDYVKPGVLTALGLCALLTILKSWADFRTDGPICLIIETIEKKEPEKKETEIKQTQCSLKLDMGQQKNIQFYYPEEMNKREEKEIIDALPSTIDKQIDKIIEKKDTTIDTDEPMDILNSFYIQDLERVMNDIENLILSAYIHGSDENKKIDLCLPDNSDYISEKLESTYSNHGSWPREDGHLLSLMQQFAINESLYLSSKKSLFSVNGPPGTGKTTLLQDIVAENVVKRARVLSGFQKASDAFTGKKSIIFDQETRNISLLDERLTGFEMLVVSSNNAAIENISKELPLRKKIAEKYQATCGYLTPVACKVFSEHREDGLKPPQEQNKPWGLVAVALGNLKNCRRFQERVFFRPSETDKQRIKRLERREYLTIWEWRKQYKGLTFAEAKSFFIEADKTLHNYLDKIKRCSDLQKKIANIDIENYCKEYFLMLDSSNLVKNKLDEKNNAIIFSLEEIKQAKDEIQANMTQHLLFKPNLLHILFRTKTAKIYQNQSNKLQLDWNGLLNKERSSKKEIHKIILELTEAVREITVANNLLDNMKNEYKNLRKDYYDLLEELKGIVLPPIDGNLENDKVQLQAFWQNNRLNELRANLYIAALALHEAWLFESLRDSHFTDNLHAISKLLSNKRPTEKSLELYIWQSLFMWIPVVSCTFASIARQFKNVGKESLGWLLIDEAGQATPQSAVGALWRAKHVLVVGDPLQIEPVFTISPNLVEGLAKHILKQDYEKWLPTLASVQTLADDANTVGTYVNVIGKNQWIGCPLRMHRRCLEPMFSVANQIAYNNKMINARIATSKNDYLLGASCWYDIAGKTIDKQYVAEQGDFLLHLLATLYNTQKKLPNLYIITPFKRIKANLHRLVTNTTKWQCYLTDYHSLPLQSVLKTWCTKHIGTVHTFQGRESKTVILLLGADEDNQGAADWASSKPNLLNVALTRAQDRIYLIGDHKLWSRKKYFSQLSGSLPLVKIETIFSEGTENLV